MGNPVKGVAVYFDYRHYMKPKEVIKVFELFNERRDCFTNADRGSEHERMELLNKRNEITEELFLVLNVICAADNRDWKLSLWKNHNEEKVAVLQILEPVNTSLFDKPQEI